MKCSDCTHVLDSKYQTSHLQLFFLRVRRKFYNFFKSAKEANDNIPANYGRAAICDY
jgi:hypothetical protein